MQENEMFNTPQVSKKEKQVGLLMLGSYFLSNALGLAVALLFKGEIGGLMGIILNSLVVTLGSVLVPALFFIHYKRQPCDSYNLRPLKANLILPCILLGVGIIFFADALNVLIVTAAEQLGINFNSGVDVFFDDIDFSNNLTFLILVICVALLPAIGEEMLCRSTVLYSVRSWGMNLAALLSGFYFALLHGSIVLLPVYGLIGYLFGCIAYKTRSVYPTMIIHFVYNLTALIITRIITSTPVTDEAYTMVEAIIASIPLVIISAILLVPGFLLFFGASKKNDIADAGNAGLPVQEYLDNYNAMDKPRIKINPIPVVIVFILLVVFAIAADFIA